jgi:hypothetical protein
VTERGQAVVLVVGGMLIGAGITTLVLKKHYQKIADAEIASVKTTYKKHYDDLVDRGDITDIEEGDDIVTKPSGVPPVVAPPADGLIAYNKIKPSEQRREEAQRLADNLGYSSNGEEPSVVNIKKVTVNVRNDALVDGSSPAEEDAREEAIERERQRYEEDQNKLPYIISVDEYMEGMDDYEDSITLTYYEGDKQLVDESEVPIDDVRQTIGADTLTKFGKLSGNGDTVYVRNERRKIDYEIVRVFDSFSDDVLGINGWDNAKPVPMEPKIRKFRDD